MTDKRLTPASRSNRWVELVPLGNEHLDFLYDLAVDEQVGVRWRFHGQVPSRDAFLSSLWTGVLVQLLVVDRKSRSPLGLVVAYNADQRHGFAYLASVMVPEADGSGLGVAALDVFVGYLFATWPLRKLYAEIPEYNVDRLGNRIGYLLKEEGRLRAHSFYGGFWWDQVIVAIYRDDYLNSNRVVRLREGTQGKDDNHPLD